MHDVLDVVLVLGHHMSPTNEDGSSLQEEFYLSRLLQN
jgi:hypothetical protein